MQQRSNPYQGRPDYTRWTKGVAAQRVSDVDPVVNFPFTIRPGDKVATAGSCFAQHIARHLRANGFNFFVPESGHPILDVVPGLSLKYNYGVYSARYGNIYTSRQLLQHFKRAFGIFHPEEQPWINKHGRYIDPFRPEIEPNGFSTVKELEVDRTQHLEKSRQMFKDLDVFVFTLGLTEYWYCKADGAVLPLCPGIVAGVYSDENYAFGNLGVDEIVKDLEEFINLLRGVNRKAKIIFTVSPVPLAATAEDQHVLVSTTYSKSVLRVAADMLCKSIESVAYFPSYEIIMGSYNRGAYFAENLRDVLEDGVEHVMRTFLRHATTRDTGSEISNRVEPLARSEAEGVYRNLQRLVATTCEEALIEASLSDNGQ